MSWRGGHLSKSLGIGLLPALILASSPQANTEETVRGSVLDESCDASGACLKLIREPIDSLPLAELLQPRRRGEEPGRGDTAFQLLRQAPPAKDPEAVLMIVYETTKTTAVPPSIWRGKIATAADGEHLVVLVECATGFARVSVYAAADQEPVASHPVELDPRRTEVWPDEAQPISTFEWTGMDAACGVSSLSATASGRHLVVHVVPQEVGCSETLLALDFASGVWRAIPLPDESPRPGI